jgi:serine/threonine-protein kinase
MGDRYPQPGTVLLGKYCVEALIGEGGMGAVLKARHLDLEESIAIKVLLPEHMDRTDIVARFLREAKASVKLKGEHVARVLDVGRLDDVFYNSPYIVMEFLDGADLNAIIKHHGAQDPAIAADLMLQACEAISEAHALGIIHRDIKASNFFVTQPEGQAPHLKVLDFGIATAPQGTSDLTNTQSVIGTPAYMAPEQMRASRTADARSDIWSLGVVLYELLEGARPFRSQVYSDLCLQVGMDPPVEMVQPIPETLKAVVMRCLEKPVERRYQSVAELAFDLMPFASDPVLARASVEQCARMLGRRTTRVFDAARAPDDVTPPPMTPPRTTRQGRDTVSDDDSETRVGRSTNSLTPVPDPGRKTPTSINGSNGEVAARPVLKTRKRTALVVGAFVATAALGAGIVVVIGPGRGDAQPTVAPAASEPAASKPDPVPAKPEPVTAEPVTAEPLKAEPVTTVPVTTVPVTTVPVTTVPVVAQPAVKDEPKPPVRTAKTPIRVKTPPLPVKKDTKDPPKKDPQKGSDDDVYTKRR